MDTIKGWTLIEMILIITILSIVGYVGISYYSFIPTWRDARFAEQFLALCRLGQNIALASECEVVLNYDNANKLSLYQKMDCQGALIKIKSYDLTLPAGLTYRQSLPFYFQKNATILNAQHVMQNEYTLATKSRILKLSGLTGMMLVYEKK